MSDPSSALAVKRARILVAGVLIFLCLGAAVVLILRAFAASALAEATQLHRQRYVTTILPSSGGQGLPVMLPGTLQGINEATVYARSNGYIVRWTRDIGSSVKRGDLLAEIAAPEVDQELSQAVAAEQQAASSESLARSTAERWKGLRDKDAVTQQDYDERESASRQARANLAAAQANVARLRNLQSFNRVLAPFDGVITSRNIDVGDLVNAGNGGAGRALFGIAQIDPLRLYVYVPQVFAAQVKVGDPVKVNLAEQLEQQFAGNIARTARAIDTATRTMQVEIRVPNPDGKLIAGSYVQAQLPIEQDGTALVVPTNVLLFRPSGTCVGIVDAKGRVRLSNVRLGTDFGNTVAVLSGLNANDRIIVNPADSLADGDVVEVTAGREGT
jgi:RND family efflux transporter MFP subunit